MEKFKAIFDQSKENSQKLFKEFYENWKDTFFKGKSGEHVDVAKQKLDELYAKNEKELNDKFGVLNKKMIKQYEKYTTGIISQMKDLTISANKAMESHIAFAKDTLQGKDTRKYKHPDLLSDHLSFTRTNAQYSLDFWSTITSEFLQEVNNISKSQISNFTKAAKYITDALVEELMVENT